MERKNQASQKNKTDDRNAVKTVKKKKKRPEKAGNEKHPGPNQKLGEMGEKAACRYLEKQGYRILARNFRARTGEIDIVAVEPSGCSGDSATEYGQTAESDSASRAWNFHAEGTERNIPPVPMGTLVFVEVKTRRDLSYGTPALAVTKTKQKHLLMAAGLYCHMNGLYGIPVRYDVIEILSLEDKLYVRHIRNAFS